MRSNDLYVSKMFELTRLWNTNLMVDCYNTCKNLLKDQNVSVEQAFTEIDIKDDPKIAIRKYVTDDKVDVFYRNWKVFTSISSNEDFQYVMADMCAVSAFFQ